MKTHNKLIALIFAALLLCLVMAGCQGSQPEASQPSTGDGPLEVIATNEQELREQLAKEDANLVIHTSGNMEITEGLVVNGIKTLKGNTEIKITLGAELGQPMLSVSAGSALTLDGPILHCNYNADGIYVDSDAELTCLSGQINYAGAYGILAYGHVTVEDLSIADCEYIAICAQRGSYVDVRGGSIQRTSSNDIYIVDGAQVNISGEPVMEGALEHAIINYGTLHIGGGKFGNVNNYLCDNYGELTVAYEGEKENGVVEFYGARNSVFLVRRGSTASFSNVYIHDTERQGISSLGGQTTISHCTFENTGSHSIDIQGGNATISHIEITGGKKSGLEASNGAKVTVNGFTVNSCDNIGIASRGATITATDITISNTGKYGLTCGTTKTGKGELTVTNAVITKTTHHGIYVYDDGVAKLENISVSEGESRGIYVAATGSCTITGNSSFQRMAKGGVEVRGKLTLENTTICNNRIATSGAGAYVADGGELTLIGGAIYSNSSAVRGGGVCVSNATLTVRGTAIYSNYATNHGGGMYVQKTSLVSLQSGRISQNKSAANGDGIYILSKESQVKVAADFYLGGNDIKVDHGEAYVKFTGSSMTYHSQKDPVLLTPNYNAPEGTVLAICNSESIANNIAVASGDGSYNIVQSGRKFVTAFAAADMDMTDADTVSVSTFAELKKAVENTTSKRNITVTADIAFTERLRLPGGVTINIQDDGTQRTLTRASGFTDSFFVTHYGTGLCLTGTAENMLILDGAGAGNEKYQSLIRAAGSTEIRNVKLYNNGSALKENDVRGALIRQIYGDVKLYDSVLSCGIAYAGGALMLENSTGYAENCLFMGNESTIGGGAIRVNGDASMELVSSQILNNHAGSTGGGLVALGAAKVTATNTTFKNNTAASYGGAVSAQDAGTQIRLIGTDSNAIFRDNSSLTAGAVYVVGGVELEISGYTFQANAATTGAAGAICVLDQSSATITNTHFYGNSSAASAGALSVSGSNAKLISCQFGKKGAGNTAADKGGAILVTDGATVEMDVADGLAGAASYNTASGSYGGGAVYVNTDSRLTAKGYLFEGNQAASGGAIYLAAGSQATVESNQFNQNIANTGNGGAAYVAGAFADTNSSYVQNEAARNGGAMIVMSGGELTMTATDAIMQGNQAKLNNGGAVFINGGGKATITGYTLENNVSGSIQVQNSGSAKMDGLTFVGEGNTVTVNGNLTLQNLTNAQILQAKNNAAITLSGNAGTDVFVQPYSYKEGQVVLTNTPAEQIATISLVQPEGDAVWSIGENGKLLKPVIEPTVATVTAGGTTKSFKSLQDAIAYANENGGEIVLLDHVTITETVVIEKNIAIVNTSGKEITMSRGADLAGDLFQVSEGAALTLGINDAEETGKLIIDGTSASAIAYRTVTVASGASFTLNKNATLQGANSTITGGALQTAGTTNLYGTISNNKSSKDGAGVEVTGGTVIIDGAAFSQNSGGSSCSGAALCIRSGATVNCQNASFTSNTVPTSKNGGAIYCAGNFTDHNSIYTNNQAKNGGAIFTAAGAAALVEHATFQNNKVSVNGAAIYANGGTITVRNSTCTGNAKTDGSAVSTIKKGNGTLYIGENVVVDGSTQTVTEPSA